MKLKNDNIISVRIFVKSIINIIKIKYINDVIILLRRRNIIAFNQYVVIHNFDELTFNHKLPKYK
jgi:hypothetical protein